MSLPDTIFDALHYCLLSDLKQMCQQLGLSVSGRREEVFERLVAFLKTGKHTEQETLPPQSCAQKSSENLPSLNGLILSGSYTCSGKTRAFLQKHIGPHFHFTAITQQFIRDRWKAGNPPTYREYIDEWNRHYSSKSSRKKNPDIVLYRYTSDSFRARYKKEFPTASSRDISNAWRAFYNDQIAQAKNYVSSLVQKPKKHPLWGE